MTEYTKGECLDTKEKFVKWVAQDKPYYWGDQRICRDVYDDVFYNHSSEFQYYQAIPKPEKRRVHFYEMDDGVHVSTTGEYGSECTNYLGSLELDE